jgi:hypothetical protein
VNVTRSESRIFAQRFVDKAIKLHRAQTACSSATPVRVPAICG